MITFLMLVMQLGDKHRINRYRLGDILERLAESRRENGGVA